VSDRSFKWRGRLVFLVSGTKNEAGASLMISCRAERVLEEGISIGVDSSVSFGLIALSVGIGLVG
jgi:hypothetical protein